ncbi:uncharacterized protein LOC129004484 isoform X1 [Macrosteles quadrilineatus]|nr:uncharacterized protein LOC129004484 isoform X1 [Macrosteles quadrilineatus]
MNRNTKRMGIFHSEQEILDMLGEELVRGTHNVSDLLKTYKEECVSLSANIQNTGTDRMRRPFIVIESNYRPPRKLLAKQLADILNGYYISVPPRCLREYLYTFEFNPRMRRAYFGLAVYAAAHEARSSYYDKPVICSGYWADQTTFAIAKEYELDDLPEKGDSVYTWPSDLLKPDVSFLLNVPSSELEPQETIPFPDDFQRKRLRAFKRLRKPRLREIKEIYYYDTILAVMQSQMLDIFMHPRWKAKNVRY